RNDPNIPGADQGRRLLLLPLLRKELADPLFLALCRIPDMGIRMDIAEIGAQITEPANERVGDRFEDQSRRSGSDGVALSFDLCLRRRRCIVNSCIEQEANAFTLEP